MAKGRAQGSLEGLKKLAEGLAALKRGRVDVGYFAGHAARSQSVKKSASAGSKPGYWQQGTSRQLIKDIEAAQAETGMTNPEIAAKMEFGVRGTVMWIGRRTGKLRKVNGIPQRSTLRMPFHLHGDKVVKRSRDAMRARVLDLARDGRKATMKMLQRLGIEGEALVQEAYATRGWGNWPPNSPTTVKEKQSDAPLIDEGQLRHSVDSRAVI